VIQIWVLRTKTNSTFPSFLEMLLCFFIIFGLQIEMSQVDMGEHLSCFDLGPRKFFIPIRQGRGIVWKSDKWDSRNTWIIRASQ
jgi:hypothetical protein